MAHENNANIMVVDDDFDVLFIVSANLAAAGFGVTRFNSPESAIEALKEQKFDVVLSDINMPRFTGMDILDAVKENSPDTPLIFMTGYADLDIALKAIKRGAFDLLTKPVDCELLRIVIGKALKIRNGRLLELDYQGRLEDDLLTKTAELRSSIELLEYTNSQLAAAEETKDLFLSTITHELRTPMNGIVGSISLLVDMVKDQEQKDIVEMANSSAANMCSLVDRIINFTMLKSGSVCRELQSFPLRDRVAAALKPYRQIAMQRGMMFSLEIQESISGMLHGDAESYLLVVESLMANAVKFTSKGEIRVVLSIEEWGDEGMVLKTSVYDTGIGIPEGRQYLVFKEFGQVDGSHTRAHGGLGIGLNTAMLVVEKVNGRLWFESREGEGSDFHFTFPFSSITA